MVSFACSRIGLTIFFLFVREIADRFKLCGSVGLSLELFIVYQFERRLQMADEPHLCGGFATFSCSACEASIRPEKDKKNTAQTLSICTALNQPMLYDFL